MTARQVAMVIDLNKCIGCQACTAACKSLWTDEPGQEYMLWNNVETKPGPGYPRDWEEGAAAAGRTARCSTADCRRRRTTASDRR